jgi:hypothetical protein
MKRQILFSVLAALAMVLVMSVPAFAQVVAQTSSAGQGLANGLGTLLGSNVALLIGVALALFGLYEWLVAQNTAVGLGMIIFGVAIAFVPDIFQGIKNAAGNVFQAVHSGGATAGATTNGQ